MKDAENKWIDEAMESLHGIKRASAPTDLFEKAMQHTRRARARVVSMPAIQVWSAAACATVLLVANLFMCLDFSHVGKNQRNDKEQFVREYFNASDGPQI
jgi:hypothetical protein